MLPDKEKNQVMNSEIIDISSSRAAFQQYVLLILIPVFLIFIIWTTKPFSDRWGTNGYLGLAIGIAVLGFMIFMLTKLATGQLKGDRLVIKKLFIARHEIKLSDIVNVETFRIKRATYLNISYRLHNKITKIWIMKPSSLFSDGPDVELILRYAIAHYSNLHP